MTEGRCLELLEEALQKVHRLEVALAAAEAESASKYWASPSPSYTVIDCPKCKTRIPVAGTVNVATKGTYGGIVRSTEPIFRKLPQ